MLNTPSNTHTEYVYDCSELLNQTENDLCTAESLAEFKNMQRRYAVLLQLLNCGIEYTTLSDLNNIH